MFTMRIMTAVVVAIAVAAIVSPLRADIAEINVVDPIPMVINETSTNVMILGLEIVNDASSPDMLSGIQLLFYNELPFAVALYRLWHVPQGTGSPVLKRSISTVNVPLEYGSMLTLTNINVQIASGNTDTVRITFDVYSDSVRAHCGAFEGTGVQLCVPAGGLTFTVANNLPQSALCPSDFDPGPPPSGYRVVFDTEAPVCGDADGNCSLNISDAVYLIAYIFGGGPAPDPSSGDVDCNEIVNIADVVYLLAYIFNEGLEPCNACP